MKDWLEIPGNRVAFDRLVELVRSREAIAFVGAGASAPIYPLWPKLLEGLINAAVDTGKAQPDDAEHWRAQATTRPLETARAIRKRLEDGRFFGYLYDTFKPQGTPAYTPTHSALARLPFRALLTTNYDNGLALARQTTGAGAEPFTWKSDNVSRWLQNALEGVPILHAHGFYSESETIVLDRDRYREAYLHDPYLQLLERLWTGGRLVIVGFGFSDPWLALTVDQMVGRAGIRKVTGPGHVAILGLDAAEISKAKHHREDLEDVYHQNVLFYPVENGDHSGLQQILGELERHLQPTGVAAPPTSTTPIPPDVLTRWFHQVAADHRRLADHLDRPAELQMLEQAWVRLELARPETGAAEDRLRDLAKTGAERIGHATLDDFLSLDRAEHPWVTGRWLVEGDPGSGKTTLLRHLAARLAREAASARVPLFLPLPKLTDPLRLPLDYVAEEYGTLCGENVLAALKQAGTEGRLVVLLDSLDEVAPERRERVDRLLAQLETSWPSCAVVLTSRPIGLGEPPPGFQKLVLQPLDDVQRHVFLEKWFRSRGKPNPQAEAVQAQAHFDSERSLRELSHNPLHLTLLTFLWEKGIEAPRRRSELYEAIFALLLEGQYKKPARTIPAQADVREALRHLAFGLTEADQTAVEIGDLEQRLLADELDAVRARLEKIWGRGKLRSFFTDVYEQTWILGPHDGPHTPWRFWHRTFREALAAERLETLYRVEGEKTFLRRATEIEGDEGRWAEPYALLAGRLGDAGQLVTRLVEINRPLGLRALATAQDLEVETLRKILGLTEEWQERQKVFEALPEQVADPDACLALIDELRCRTRNGNDLFFLRLSAEQAAERWPTHASRAQQLLSRFFDHIPSPADPELFRSVKTKLDGRVPLWRTIPKGTGWIGSPEGVGHSDEHPRHQVEVVRPFALAAVPVTNAQYAAFDPSKVDASKPQHPVVNVTWYEAVSFCRWLASQVPGCEQARLPTEEEWEYACRAGSETVYWSGDKEADLQRVGWYEKNAKGHPHAVGEKNANPWGLYDVHGNVLEWTASVWDGEKYQQRSTKEPFRVDPAEMPADLAAPPGDRRVMRGGCCWNVAYWARSAYRYFGVPAVEFWFFGFRVLLLSAPSEV